MIFDEKEKFENNKSFFVEELETDNKLPKHK